MKLNRLHQILFFIPTPVIRSLVKEKLSPWTVTDGCGRRRPAAVNESDTEEQEHTKM